MGGALSRISFRQWLLAAFVLIGALLGGASLHALFTFENLLAQSRESASLAIALNADAQSLNERSLAMERAARQSLILGDAPLRRRFDEAAHDAHEVLHRLQARGLPHEHADTWRRQLASIAALLDERTGHALERERQAAARFRELDGLSADVTQQVGELITRRYEAMQAELDRSRQRLATLITAAIVLAVVLALGLGLALARPLQRLEHAIVGLGENRLELPIDIRGPADVRRVSQQLDWLRLRLGELDADKARFLRHVSHEFKTPLAALREGVAVLEDGVAGALGESQREVVRILHHNTQLLQGHIEALLRFNSAAFEARQLRREPTDLLELLQAQADAQRLQWQAAELELRIEGGPLVLPVDRAKLGTALANLLSNAIRFSPRGGRLRVVLSHGDGQARIDLIDQGPGVAAPDRERIFEPFYRGERQPESAVRGTGIGLSIVQEYIAAHGGRVALLPSERGAHFRVELPHAN